MMYDNPHYEGTDLWYEYGKGRHKMHGGVFLENIVQFLARLDTMHDALRIGDRGFNVPLGRLAPHVLGLALGSRARRIK